jgi:Na+-transporting methylmalonyl-CoA/oxaloacetate decarboxylase gamma subunit
MDWGFGWTMMGLGMGVTLLTLVLLGLIIGLLNKIFPYKKDEKKD